MMIQVDFATKAKTILEHDDSVIGLAVGGSWLSDEIDEFSDLDLILITDQKVSGDIRLMLGFAERLGNLLSGFTGDHVGEPRLLICLYDDPLLHVDIKFLTLDEFDKRVETPVLLLDRTGQLENTIRNSTARFPVPDYQWIEDRFWTWVHYALLKIGRGEYLEALDFFGFLRMVVLGPLLHIKNGNLPRGVRKAEFVLAKDDVNGLIRTVPAYNRDSLFAALQNAVSVYRQLRTALFDDKIQLREGVEEKVMMYFDELENRG